jgi:hypothetical protein
MQQVCGKCNVNVNPKLFSTELWVTHGRKIVQGLCGWEMSFLLAPEINYSANLVF